MSEWWFIVGLGLGTILAILFIVYPLRHRPVFASLLAPVLFVLVISGYYSWGGFGQWQQYVQENKKQERAKELLKTFKNPQELIDKLRARLDDSPQSAKGWYLLAKVYSSQGNQKEAVLAFAKAYHFKPEEEQYAVFYAHSLWVANNQQFNKQIRDIFYQLLGNNPNQPDALAMLAMDSFLAKRDEQAIEYWQRLLKLTSPQSEEAQSIRKAIAKAEERSRQTQK